MYKYGNPDMNWNNTITCRNCGMSKFIGVNEGMDNLERFDLIAHEQTRAKCCSSPDYAMYPHEKDDTPRKIFADFIKTMELEVDDQWDDYKIGYTEAILNLAGEFTNGRCEDCPYHDLTCFLKECWIDRIKKLIYKEQDQLRKKAKLTDEIIEQSYNEVLATHVNDRCWGRVSLEELYKHIRKNYIRKLTTAQFREFMAEFMNKYLMGDFGFERASGSRAEVKRYGFYRKEKPSGLYYYIHKGQCTK